MLLCYRTISYLIGNVLSSVEVKLEAPTSGADGDTVDISRLDLRIGKIIAVEKHPDAEKLYVETVDVGEEKPRTIVSGLVEHIPIEKVCRNIFKKCYFEMLISHGKTLFLCCQCALKVVRHHFLIHTEGYEKY